eukprot:gene13238-17743_t
MKQDSDTEIISISGNEIISELISYCESKIFRDAINSFKNDHKRNFQFLSEAKSIENVELPLETTIIFNDYKSLVNELLEGFTKEFGVSQKQLYRYCEDSFENKYCPIFEEDENRWFVETMMSWTDFDYFINIMMNDVKKGYKSDHSESKLNRK